MPSSPSIRILGVLEIAAALNFNIRRKEGRKLKFNPTDFVNFASLPKNLK